MKIHHQICILSIALIGIGCKPGHSLVGKWSTTNQGHAQNVEFTADSKMVAVMQTDQPFPMTATVDGTYSLDNDKFSVKATDMTVKTQDKSKQALIDAAFGSHKKDELDTINKSGSDNKIVWKSDDEFVVTDKAGQSQTFTRVKG